MTLFFITTFLVKTIYLIEFLLKTFSWEFENMIYSSVFITYYIYIKHFYDIQITMNVIGNVYVLCGKLLPFLVVHLGLNED